jgi:hypothetical protein
MMKEQEGTEGVRDVVDSSDCIDKQPYVVQALAPKVRIPGST